MTVGSKNQNLHKAKDAKKDEFYTQLADIGRELTHYNAYFKGKVVYCNCDDPYESNFFRHFALKFRFLGLKKLIATCYAGSPIANTELSLFDHESAENKTTKAPHKIEIFDVDDHDGTFDLADIAHLLRNKKNFLTRLKGDGDFRSEECVELLKEADVVVTNPPFSLFREYVAQLVEYDKKFVIIGNQNSITYKEIFKLIKANKLWLGASIHSGDREFCVPDDYPITASGYRIGEDGKKYIRVKGVRWFTNLDYPKRHEDLKIFRKYTPEEYPKYDNYDAINVNKTSYIPADYYEVMGVPITFLDKYNPEQFEILGMDDHRLVYPEWRGRGPDLKGKPIYRRIIIKRKLRILVKKDVPLIKWKPTTLPLGTKAGRLSPKIVRCCARNATGKNPENNVISAG